MTGRRVTPCSGAIVFDATRRLLLIRRGHEPGRGLWSVPGGRRLAGETASDACRREVREETGLEVEVTRLAGSVDRHGVAGEVYRIDDFCCEVVSGVLVAGDDADEARWVTREQLRALPLTPGLLDALAGWDALPD